MGAIDPVNGYYQVASSTTGSHWVAINTNTTNYTISTSGAPPAQRSELKLLDDRVQQVCREGQRALGS